jgi:RNA polymerase sigma factor (sigma-70 family)
MGPELVTLHWRTHRAVLLRKCLFLTRGDAREAEDLLSDAYLRGLEAAHASKLNVESPVGWWLAIIANLARDRRRRVRHRLFRDAPSEVVEEIADAGPGLEQIAEARQHLERTLDRVRSLTGGQRSALAGRGVGADYSELARTLGTKPANVRKLVQTARAALR